MLTFTRESSSESQTLAIAGEVAKCLRPRDVIALDGALGAGKTCFVRGLVAGLGGDPRQVSSPTFVLHQEYEVGRHGGTEARRHESGESRRDEETERRREEVGGLPSPSGRGAGGQGEQPEIARVAHIDAYRMTSWSEHDLGSIGWDELLEADDLIIAIEWPTKIPQDALPRLRTIRIQFEVVERHEGTEARRHEGAEAGTHSSSLRPQALTTFRRLSFAIPSSIEERFASLQRQTRQCRTCGREITADNPFFPFCSERCKLADLGAWFSEKYTITRPLEQRDLEEG